MARLIAGRRSARSRPNLALAAVVVVLLGAVRSFVPAPLEDEVHISRREALSAALFGATVAAAPELCRASPLWRALPEDDTDQPKHLYPARFTAYLTRFLLNFDPDFQAMWKDKGEPSPLEQLESKEFRRDARFARFARTVELALSSYAPPSGGSHKLLEVLLKDYGGSTEAKRQICILFSLLQEPEDQPVKPLRQLLRTVENASIAKVEVVDRGAFSIDVAGNAPPQLSLTLPVPPGRDGRRATAVCRLRRANSTTFVVEAATLGDAGSGYAADMDLTPQVDLPADAQMLRAPKFTVRVTSPFRALPKDRRAELADSLKSKLTNLLPSFLLPAYSEKLGRLVPDQSLPLTPDPTPLEEVRRLDEVFGGDRQLDRFRADFVFAEFDPMYGPVGLSPLERERRLYAEDFLRLMVAGSTAALVRTLLFLPIQNVKVRMQTNPQLGGGSLGAALQEIATTEPPIAFFKAVDVAAIYAIVFGFFSFGVKEFLTRELVIQFPGLNELVAIIFASIVSVFVTMAAGTPWEVLTTKVMAGEGSGESGGRFWGLSLLRDQLQADPKKAAVELYEEYWLLSGKELAFVVTKFLVFDSLREAILFVVPAFAEAQSLLVACGCGAVAGALGAITSHPIDTLFALRTTGGAKDEIPSLDRLFRGVGARVLIYSPGIALTFLVYDAAKTWFGVGGGAVMQTLDLLNPSP